MKVILTETIDSIGIIGAEVNVAKGFARNYLFPQSKAVLATPQNKKMLEHQKAKFEIQIAKEREMAMQMAEKVSAIYCKISAKVSDEDRLYGSITTRDIADAIASQDVTIEKRMILLAEPIKNLGIYKVPIRLYKGVKPEITVEVVPEDKPV
ncbi:MAG: 50S ribosomal protein L9 [Proteobacteria bacterium]|nr:50S ribosomal protein L9 [Pseudomonadota bacterium]